MYHTTGCHLCELAEAVLEEIRAAHPDLRWESIDIATDPHLLDQYAWRIPVVHFKGKPENDLGWPFDRSSVSAFLNPTAR
ncbi:MAG: glutaredoxin family protein [Saccharospirillum sp.]